MAGLGISKISLRQIRYFLAVARHGNFSAAARELSVSQPALGQQVKQLEENLDCTLFTRHARGVVLTEAGRVLVEEGSKAVRLLETASKKIDNLRAIPNTHLRFGVTTTAGKALIGRLVEADLRHNAKPLRFSFVEAMSDHLIARVSAGGLDAAIAYDSASSGSLTKLPLFKEPFVLIGNKRLLRSHGPVEISRLAEFPLIVGAPGQPYRTYLEGLARKHGTVINIGAEFGSLSLKQEMIRHGSFIVGPYGRFLNEDSGDLAAVEFTPPIIRTMYLFFRPDLPKALHHMLSAAVVKAVDDSIKAGALVRVDRVSF